MRRISQDFSATSPGQCAVCFRRIYPGMIVLTVEMTGGRRAMIHSLCESEFKKTE